MTGEMIFQIIIQHVESELFVSLKLLHESWSILNYLETHQSWIPDSISTLAKWSDIEILGFSDSTTTSFNRLIHDQQFPNLFSRYVFFSPWRELVCHSWNRKNSTTWNHFGTVFTHHHVLNVYRSSWDLHFPGEKTFVCVEKTLWKRRRQTICRLRVTSVLRVTCT